jgi:hypothetical protein
MRDAERERSDAFWADHISPDYSTPAGDVSSMSEGAVLVTIFSTVSCTPRTIVPQLHNVLPAAHMENSAGPITICSCRMHRSMLSVPRSNPRHVILRQSRGRQTTPSANKIPAAC